MTLVLLAIAILWVAPLFIAVLVSLASNIFPPFRDFVREQLFGPEETVAGVRARPSRLERSSIGRWRRANVGSRPARNRARPLIEAKKLIGFNRSI